MLARATTFDLMVAGTMADPARFEAAGINQPMQDTLTRGDITASSSFLELEDGGVFLTELGQVLELETSTIDLQELELV